MGQPIVHFEIIGQDHEKLTGYYTELFGWEINSDNPMKYGMVARDGNTSANGAGIGGGIMGMAGHPGMDGEEGHVTFYVEVPDVEAALAKAESLGGSRVMGPDDMPGGPTIGQFKVPEGHMIGVVGPMAQA